MFFSEEKNQKTFTPCACREIRDRETRAGIKSFLLLFFKKEGLPPLKAG